MAGLREPASALKQGIEEKSLEKECFGFGNGGTCLQVGRLFAE
jgi:hypothetical protein